MAITEFGVIKGCFMTIKRILRCNPFSKGGVDHPNPANNNSLQSKIKDPFSQTHHSEPAQNI